MCEKSKGTAQCGKKTIICDIGATQYEDEIVNLRKKVREPPMCGKKLSHVMLKLHNVKMEPSNMRKK